jgi:anhydro-N-acetylmuramic acid kinase
MKGGGSDPGSPRRSAPRDDDPARTRPALQTAVGVISGTSMDGIDVALIESDGEARLKTGPSATFPYPPPVAERLRAVVADLSEAQAPQLELERLVTDAHVAAVEGFFQRYSVARERLTLVGLHGQTILHRPRAGLTRQLMDGARAAAALKIDVVTDFRSADVGAGGEGAPLAPIYHAAMAADLERPVMILNWGGVGNITYLGVKGEIIAFDTGPANALLDDFLIVRRGLAYDEDGALGESGRVNPEALASLMSDPYFERPAPKSLDRNHFSARAACVKRLSDADGAATLSAFTVESTAAALKHVPQAPARWLVGGGGRRNPSLMRRLSERLQARVEPVEAIGFDGDSIEAQCFAYLGLRSLRRLPISFPATTGVPKPLTGGVFWPASK